MNYLTLKKTSKKLKIFLTILTYGYYVDISKVVKPMIG